MGDLNVTGLSDVYVSGSEVNNSSVVIRSVIGNGSLGNGSILGLEQYGSDEALAAVELFVGYPDALLTFASICCIIFMIIGVPGNLITIVALARCKKVRNATAIFIISLSVSDLLFCCFNLPLAASTFWNQSWRHGRTLCKMFPLARYALIAVSLLTVLAITINRYIMIARPTLYPMLYTKRNLALMIATLWIFCFSILLPTWFGKWGQFSLNAEVGSCTITEDVNGSSPKKVLFICGFFIPGLAILVCYARIFFIVRKVARKSRPTVRVRPHTMTEMSMEGISNVPPTKPTSSNHTSFPTVSAKRSHNPFTCLAIPEISSTSGLENSGSEHQKNKIADSDKFLSRSSEAIQKLRTVFTPAPKSQPTQKLLPSKKDRKLRTMIMAIMLSFVICHLPISMSKIFLEFTTHPFVQIASYITLYLTTCINPIIYVVMSNEYRQAYKNLITCVREQDFGESTVLRRITSMKTLASMRKSKRKVVLESVNTQSPT